LAQLKRVQAARSCVRLLLFFLHSRRRTVTAAQAPWSKTANEAMLAAVFVAKCAVNSVDGATAALLRAGFCWTSSAAPSTPTAQASSSMDALSERAGLHVEETPTNSRTSIDSAPVRPPQVQRKITAPWARVAQVT